MKYTSPVVELKVLMANDVITASQQPVDPDNPSLGEEERD